MDSKIYDEVVQSIVKSVMMAVNKKLTDYDKKLDSKLSNVKIGSNNLLPGSVNTSIIKPGAVTGGSIAEGSIDIEYMYSLFTHKEGKAYMVFRVSDEEKFTALLAQHGIAMVAGGELGLQD